MIDFASANGVSLRYDYLRRPHAPIIVLNHELGGALESWTDVVSRLAPHYALLHFDQRGFGLSEKPPGPVRLEQLTGDLSCLLDALGIAEPVITVGAAVGAAVAIGMAVHHPSRVRGLVGLAPATGIPPPRRAGIDALAQRIQQTGMRPFIEDDMVPGAWPEVLPRRADAFRRFVALQLANEPRSLGETYRMLANLTLEEDLQRVSCPALMVGGAFDRARPREVVERVVAAIPGCQFRMIESGHFMAVQTPEIVADLIDEFMRGL